MKDKNCQSEMFYLTAALAEGEPKASSESRAIAGPSEETQFVKTIRPH